MELSHAAWHGPASSRAKTVKPILIDPPFVSIQARASLVQMRKALVRMRVRLEQQTHVAIAF